LYRYGSKHRYRTVYGNGINTAPCNTSIGIINTSVTSYFTAVLYRTVVDYDTAQYQPPSFEVVHRETQDLRRRTEIIPVKESHTRIEPLALASGHGRYITVTPERKFFPIWNGRCT
jgi:hypothetical protein